MNPVNEVDGFWLPIRSYEGVTRSCGGQTRSHEGFTRSCKVPTRSCEGSAGRYEGPTRNCEGSRRSCEGLTVEAARVVIMRGLCTLRCLQLAEVHLLAEAYFHRVQVGKACAREARAARAARAPWAREARPSPPGVSPWGPRGPPWAPWSSQRFARGGQSQARRDQMLQLLESEPDKDASVAPSKFTHSPSTLPS